MTTASSAKPPTDAELDIAGTMIARELAKAGYVPDPSLAGFVADIDGSMARLAAPVDTAVKVDESNGVVDIATHVKTLKEYQEGKAKDQLKLATVRSIEIATYMLANKHESLKEIADKFKMTPATLTRIIGTDSFQYILQAEAKRIVTSYATMRTQLELKMESAMILTMERLIERLQVANNEDTLLKVLKELGTLLNMGNKGPTTAVQVNNYGVSGAHLRAAVSSPSAEKPAIPAG